MTHSIPQIVLRVRPDSEPRILSSAAVDAVTSVRSNDEALALLKSQPRFAILVTDERSLSHDAKLLSNKEPLVLFVGTREQSTADAYWTSDSPTESLDSVLSLLMELSLSRRELAASKREMVKTTESERRLELALEAARIGQWEIDLDSGLADRTPRHDQIFGFEEKTDQWSYEIFLNQYVHPQDRARVDELFQEALSSTHQWEFECRIVRADGDDRWIWAKGEVTRVEAGDPRAMVGLVMDITDRKSVELALQESEARFREMAANAPVMIWVTKPDGTCVYLNKVWYDFTGQTQKEGLGLGWLEAVHPDDRDFSGRVFLAANEAQEAFRLEYRVRRHDGVYRWAIDAASPRFSGQGEFLGYIGSVIDISDRKQAEEMLKEHDKQKDQFLAMLAHELRNPLSAISNALSLARGDANTEELNWSHKVIDAQVSHLAHMLDDLLDVSRITRGKIQLRKTGLDLTDVVRSAADTVKPFALSRKHVLEIDLEDGTFPLYGDRTRLEQVVVNLLNNAVKYTEIGGTIKLRLFRGENSRSVVEVEDTGMGMSQELLVTAFELFAQGDRSLARSEGGLGIGLTLVRRLVQLHEGTVTAQSAGEGAGSLFRVDLPYQPEIVPEPVTASLSKPKRMRPSRVLIVDDNVESATSLSKLLQREGFRVCLSHNGLDALSAADEFQPESVLLDLGLPGLDGYEVASRLRQKGFDETLLVAVSGYGEEGARRRSQEAGFDLHLVKPARISQITEVCIKGSVKILLVEDNPIVGTAAKNYLKKQGYRIRLTVSGEDALKLTESWRPDILVSDLNLAGRMTGMELVSELSQAYQDLYCIALTGTDEPHIVNEARARGFHRVFVKPVPLPALAAEIQESL